MPLGNRLVDQGLLPFTGTEWVNASQLVAGSKVQTSWDPLSKAIISLTRTGTKALVSSSPGHRRPPCAPSVWPVAAVTWAPLTSHLPRLLRHRRLLVQPLRWASSRSLAWAHSVSRVSVPSSEAVVLSRDQTLGVSQCHLSEPQFSFLSVET